MVATNNLRLIRTKKGLSQLALAATTRISPSVISNIENGKVYPYPGWRERLAQALDVSETDLFPGVE